MPKPSFFRHLGLFVEENFLDPATCEQLRGDVLTALSEKGTIIGGNQEHGTVDETRRNVLRAKVQKSTSECLEKRLWEIKPQIEEHFRVTLSGFEPPNFLRYAEGAFYCAHHDVTAASPPDIANRRVSAVVFLNSRGDKHEPDRYGGGSLTFYGLMASPQWEKCAFSLEAAPGLLIAFPSETLHEVQRVTFGERLTIAVWFTT